MKEATTAAKEAPAPEVVKDEPVREVIVLDLPPSAGGGINHAGRFYLSRTPYSVAPEVARDLLEVQNRCKAHESSLQANENIGRRRQQAYLRGAA